MGDILDLLKSKAAKPGHFGMSDSSVDVVVLTLDEATEAIAEIERLRTQLQWK
jgi:hypothetical protein